MGPTGKVLLEAGFIVAGLIERLVARRSAVVLGPIGSGVTSALAASASELRARDIAVTWVPTPGVGALLGHDLPGALEQLDRLGAEVLVVDDLHLLEPDEAHLLAAVALNSGTQLLGGMHPDAGEASTTLLGLAGPATFSEVELRPFGHEQARAACDAIVGGPTQDATVAEMVRLTAGWPGLLHDLVTHAAANGSLRSSIGLHRLVRPAGVPPRTARRLERGISRWPATSRHALTRLAVARQLPGRAADVPRGLVVSRLVRERTARLDVAVPLLADALVAATPHADLRPIALELLDVLEGAPAVRRVRWKRLADVEVTSAEVIEATLSARAAGHHWEASGLLELIDPEHGATPETELLRAELAEEEGDHELAASIRTAIVGDANCPGAARAMAVKDLAMADLWYFDRADRAVDLLTFAAGAAADPRERSMIRALLGGVYTYMGQPVDALALLEPVVRPGGAAPALVAAMSTALAQVGRCGEALTWADEAMATRLATAEQPGLATPEVYLNAQAFAAGEAGEIARGLAAVASLPAAGVGQASRHGWRAIAQLRLLLLSGDLERARHAAEEAAQVFTDLGRLASLRWAVAGQALVDAYQGRSNEARRHVAHLDRIGPSGVQFLETDVDRARAFTAAAAGELAAAQRIVRRSAEQAERRGALGSASAAWHDLVRLGAPQHATAALRRLAPSVDSRWHEPRTRHAVALSTRDARALLDVVDDFRALGAHILALEAAAQALAVATAARSGPLVRAATASVLTARVACADARTPALRDAGAATLTSREREVSELAAGGRTSKEVAATLGISVRTVDNLLHRAYGKLGVRSREGLAELFNRW